MNVLWFAKVWFEGLSEPPVPAAARFGNKIVIVQPVPSEPTLLHAL